MTDPTVAILAGGLGTRLRPAVADRPKVLAPVGDRPFLARLLDQLAGAGFSEVVLCTGYLGDQIEAQFGARYRGLHLAYSREATPLGTGGAVRHAVPHLRSDAVMVMNGDSYCDIDLRRFLGFFRERPGDAAIALAHAADASRFGSVQIDSDDRILRFDEKMAGGGAGGWINAGIYLIRRTLLEIIPPDRAISIERELFPTWIESGLYGFRVERELLDIGTPESYASAGAFLG